jgi:hypothetical protein
MIFVPSSRLECRLLPLKEKCDEQLSDGAIQRPLEVESCHVVVSKNCLNALVSAKSGMGKRPMTATYANRADILRFVRVRASAKDDLLPVVTVVPFC